MTPQQLPLTARTVPMRHVQGSEPVRVPADALCVLASADSLAWSYNARREPPLSDCRGKHKNCANCPLWALDWREALLSSLDRDDGQMRLAGVA